MNRQNYTAELLGHMRGRSANNLVNTDAAIARNRHWNAAAIRVLQRINHVDGLDRAELDGANQRAIDLAYPVDKEKASSLYPAINSLSDRSEIRSQIGSLAELLDPEMRQLNGSCPEFHETLASSCYLADHAYRIGQAAEAMVGANRAEYSIVSMSSQFWRFSPVQLEEVSLVELVNEVSDTFEFLGVNDQCGSLLAFVHGHFDPLHCTFSLSLFGLADRPMTEMIGRLRGFPTFQDREHTGELICIQPLDKYAQPLTTLVQTDWPVKIEYLDGDKPQSIQFEAMIDHPYLVPSLLWRDRWDLAAATLMIGLNVKDDRLIRLHGDH